MSWILRPGLRRLFRLPLRSTHAIRDDVDEELESLIASRVDYLVARGVSPDTARTEALRRLGASLDDARDQLHASAEHRERRMSIRETFESALQDVRYAVRGLVQRPAFTIVAVLTLAIGIGGTTAIFSAVNVLLLRPLPYARPDELMNLTLIVPSRGVRPANDHMVWSYPKYTAFRDAQRVFEQLSLYSAYQFIMTSGDVERVPGEYIGATYFRTLGVPVVRGRDFDGSIDRPDAPAQTILSYALWERRYNADPTIIGHTIDVDKRPYVVVGIAPRDFKGLSGESELFIPIMTRPMDELNGPQSHEFSLIGRRAAGTSATQASAAMTVLGMRVNDAYPNTIDGKKWGARAEPLNDARLSPTVRRSLLVLFGAVGFVLLIACVNVANLLLGRASTRRREIAVRLAIGAGRGRLIRLLLTESLCLALVGGIASVGVAWLGVHALGTVDPSTTLRLSRDNSFGAMSFSTITLDWRALAFTLGVTLSVGVLFGLVPALGATRASFTDALKHDATRSGARHGLLSMRRILVIVEVALAIMLLAGSGLMIRSLTKLLAIDPGFDASGVLTLRLNIPPGVPSDSMPTFYTEMLDRVRAVPGVSDAALSNCAPLSGGCNATFIHRLDQPKEDIAHLPLIGIDWVTPAWFATMHVPLKRGRMFAATDRVGAPKVVLINDRTAKQLFPNEDPIGKRVEIGQGGLDDAEIVGIVGDVRQQPDSEAHMVAYTSYLQSPRPGMLVFVRTARDAASIGPDVRRAIHDVAPQFPVYDVRTMLERSARATAQIRFSATLLAIFAATALALASIGIYGVLSLAVAARTREIGIRIALGAEQQRVRRLVIGEGVVLASIGAAVGIVGALASTRVLQSMLFDLTSADPLTYVVITLVLGAAAIAASWIPAGRAAKVDPIVALRAD